MREGHCSCPWGCQGRRVEVVTEWESQGLWSALLFSQAWQEQRPGTEHWQLHDKCLRPAHQNYHVKRLFLLGFGCEFFDWRNTMCFYGSRLDSNVDLKWCTLVVKACETMDFWINTQRSSSGNQSIYPFLWILSETCLWFRIYSIQLYFEYIVQRNSCECSTL